MVNGDIFYRGKKQKGLYEGEYRDLYTGESGIEAPGTNSPLASGFPSAQAELTSVRTGGFRPVMPTVLSPAGGTRGYVVSARWADVYHAHRFPSRPHRAGVVFFSALRETAEKNLHPIRPAEP